MSTRGVIARYRPYLPVTESTPVITLQEGDTPLLRLRNVEKHIGCEAELYAKFEGLNPTASFKDRGMTLAVSKAIEEGADAVLCASTGNTSASAAAYAARARIKCAVILPEGAIALGKLAQALLHGAVVLPVAASFDGALDLVRQISATYRITLVNSVNPYRLAGQKTAAFEICDLLGDAPDFHILPVGNAGNITAYWMGYKEYFAAGLSKRRPKMYGFQAEGAAPIVRGAPVEKPETIASAIRIGNPASWRQALEARDESGGEIRAVSDAAILEAYRLLARLEGIFAEPASAAALAGAIQMHADKLLVRGFRAALTLTGHGLKDPGTALKVVPEPKSVKADVGAIADFLGLKKGVPT
ncbi:MAG: threonine synthase [Candidatus Lindowbacteria bacterium RIFCSPLOWO2_12_FULL_62_27]|nr:MAG: threonine synthase [Candidatus Lindowbacteria bacterium RIFCSPLOWO2_12_FULL_62_27]OGH58768.1 MAG: threonine synthase [Candidatus Lindowbacteria bacterium RIFCSPLOWO2_02_FULL_62_12]